MSQNNFVIGVDYGTDSVRSVIVDASTGNEVAASVYNYPRWRDGLYCDASKNQFRQHPLDYIEGLESTIKACLATAGTAVRSNIRAISVDTTGSTPVAVDVTGTPLSMNPEFAKNPNAMFVLWKDHTAVREAAEINSHAQKFETNYLQYVGGIYSSEWFWAKLLHVLRDDREVRAATHSWVEHCDWIPFLLTGGTEAKALKRGVCSAGTQGTLVRRFRRITARLILYFAGSLVKRIHGKIIPRNIHCGQACRKLMCRMGGKAWTFQRCCYRYWRVRCAYGCRWWTD